MSSTIEQRRQRLRVRQDESGSWRVKQRLPIAGWTCEGKPIAHGGAWPTAEGVVHFAAKADVPADWPLEETRLSLNLGGEGLIRLDYADGAHKTFGVDPYHEEFPVEARAFSIASQNTARLPFGQPVRDPRLQRAELIRIDLALDNFERLMVLTMEAIGQLDGRDAQEPLLDAAERAMRMLDLPSRSQAYNARIADTGRQRTIWALPKFDENPAPFDAAQSAAAAAATMALTEDLRALKLRFPPEGKVAVTGHAHIDLAWLWPYAETRRKLRRTFSTALRHMERAPDFRFNQSTAHYYAELETDDPDMLKEIVARAKTGQWETVGGLWIEPDTNMPTGESLVRQALYGQRYFEKVFGVRHRVCWLPDCFGFSPAMPQILRQSGMDSFFTIKVNWSETNKFPHDLFWWEGLDGSKVLAHTFDNPVNGYNGEFRPACTTPTWRNFRAKAKHDETLLAVGYGDGGGGVTWPMIEAERLMRDFPAIPQAHWDRIDDYFARAHVSAAKAAPPTWVGEIYLELHRGTFTTQSGVKRLHRRAERALITAETVASLAHLLGGAAPASLEPAWRVVLKNEFHDILPGSSIHEVYVDAERELGGVIDEGMKRQGAALAAIAGSMPKGAAADALVVVNPSLDARPLRVETKSGFVASADIVPPLSVAVFDAKTLAPAPGLSVTPTTLENAHLRATLGADGTIASLIHKATGREALAGRGNQLWAYVQDRPREWDAWEIDEDYTKSGQEITTLESMKIVENGPHRAAIEVRRKFRHSSITQVYALGANAKRLDIHTHIDWHDRRIFLRSLTPVAVRSPRATFECAHGVVERATHVNTSWEEAKFEVPAHRFADLSEAGFGLAVLNDAKYGHSARGNVLGLSLLRSPVYPDPMADEGEQSFTYALMPHAGAWHEGGVREEADDLNQPLLSAPGAGLAPGVHTPLALGAGGLALSGLKAAEDGDGLVLRVYEPSGGRATFTPRPPKGWSVTGAVNLLEEPIKVADSTALAPFELRSVRLKRG